jgi:ABC-type branched-subunit amino acid transport system substrate-binding protein
MNRRFAILASVATVWAGAPVLAADAGRQYGPGVSDTEIRIGQTMPYSGAYSAAGAIGRTESAYFKTINAHGGINGRRVRFISLDDEYSPPKTLEQTRRLVEQEDVLAIVESFGTPTNAAIQKYLNERRVPQLFIQAGASRWNDPVHFPWTMALVDLLRSEAELYAGYILANHPDGRIAVLYQNDDFGRDYLNGLKERLGAQADRMVIAIASYEASDPTVDSQVVTLASSGANILLIAAGPKFAALAIRKAHDIGWHPVRFLAQVSAASQAALNAAGPDKVLGVITASSFKSTDDPQWANDPDYLAWQAFMHTNYPEGDIRDGFTFAGYSNATLFGEVLRRCGDELTRGNLMAVATHLQGVRMPALLPGITVNTSPADYEPLKQMLLERFDGRRWVPITHAPAE